MKMELLNQGNFILDYYLKIDNALRNILVKKGYNKDELTEIMHVFRSTISIKTNENSI